MNHLEKVEKLRQRADVSYEEAKEALESCDWDILDALILLESQGKVKAPASGEAAGTSVSSEHRGHFGESDASASGEQAQEEPTHALAVCETKEEENKKGQDFSPSWGEPFSISWQRDAKTAWLSSVTDRYSLSFRSSPLSFC